MKMPYKEIKTRVVRKDIEDKRRHKTHCKYYNQGVCQYNWLKCFTSQDCLHYEDCYNKNQNKSNNKSKNNKKDKAINKNINNKQKCSIIIQLNSFKKNQIEVELKNCKSYLIEIRFRNVEKMLSYLNKIKITRIVLKHGKEYRRCKINEDIKVELKRISKHKVLCIKANIVGLMKCNIEADQLSKKLCSEFDPLIGNVDIVINPKKSKKDN